MKYLVLSTLLTFCLFATGCGLGESSAEVDYSGFDNSRTVDIRVHWNTPKSLGEGTGLGAQWSEATPDSLILRVGTTSFQKHFNITGATLNIDGKLISLKATDNPTETRSADVGSGLTSHLSTKGFVTNLATVEKILHSRRTWLRVYTSSGSLENAVIEGEEESQAYRALVRFMQKVKENSGAKR
jgi:hypothetical protein